MKEYAVLRNANESRPIPVANTGGRGTAEGHWRQADFDHELMTGYAESSDMPMLGYAVDMDAADPYTMAGGAPLIPALTGPGRAAAPLLRDLSQDQQVGQYPFEWWMLACRVDSLEQR